MRMASREDVQVWCEHGRPVRLVVDGERWRIIDTPTRSDGGLLFQSWRLTASTRFTGIDSGAYVPVVAESFPFDDAPAAHRYIGEGKNIGKVVLVP